FDRCAATPLFLCRSNSISNRPQRRRRHLDGAPPPVKNVHGGCGELLNVGGNRFHDVGSCCGADLLQSA
ncbi:hypothetical protein ES288_D06G116900v1, partial [Gossypium darwinii]